MAQVNVYESYSWHECILNQNQWRGTEPTVMVIPEDVDKVRLAKDFPGFSINTLYTIPELIEYYIKSLGGSLISIYSLESILSAIIG